VIVGDGEQAGKLQITNHKHQQAGEITNHKHQISNKFKSQNQKSENSKTPKKGLFAAKRLVRDCFWTFVFLILDLFGT
jgi:hypothetical protein